MSSSSRTSAHELVVGTSGSRCLPVCPDVLTPALVACEKLLHRNFVTSLVTNMMRVVMRDGINVAKLGVGGCNLVTESGADTRSVIRMLKIFNGTAALLNLEHITERPSQALSAARTSS